MKTLEKSLKILEQVAGSPVPAGVRDLARTVCINTTTVHKILSTLERAGYLRNSDGKYSLGLKAYLLGSRESYFGSLYGFCLPYMERLRDALGHTVALTVRDGGEIMSLGVCTPRSGLAVMGESGIVIHAHTMASGKVILADMDGAGRDSYLLAHPLVKVTGSTVVSRSRLDKELQLVRERGYAVVRDEQQEGVSALAAGIRTGSGGLIAVLGVKVPSMLLDGKAEGRIRKELLDSVARICDGMDCHTINN